MATTGLVAAVAALLTLAPPATAAPPRAAAHSAAAATATPGSTGQVPVVDEAQAVTQAVATGRPVAVTSLTTETQTAVATPDGAITMSFDASPQRVRLADGSWAPVDTTMAVSGGLVVPRQAAVAMAFSNGGSTTPLATVTRDGLSYRVFAPWPLPTPVLSGATATYSSVLPGVDLVVSATADGFSHDLVVNTPAAAANPALAAVTYPIQTVGLQQVQDPSGSVREVDAAGQTVFGGDAPKMWDAAGSTVAGNAPLARPATGTPAAAVAVVTGASTSAHTAPMIETVAGSSVTIRPDTAMLTSPTTVFPLVLDPVTTSYSITGWTVLDRENHTRAYWKDSPDPAGSLSVGYDGYDTGSVRRSIVQFDTHALAGKHILGATYTPYEIWSANCTKYEADLYRTTTISSSTSWDHPPTWSALVDSQTVAHGWTGSGSTCTASSPVGFDATAAVVYTAGQSATTTTLGMKATASGESTTNDWKQFATPSGTHKPTLSVTYISKPGVPTSTKMASPALSCATSSSAPAFIATTTPTLSAIPVGNDGSSSHVRPNFQIYNGTTLVWSGSPASYTADGLAGTVKPTALSPGVLYYYHARSEYQWTYNGASGSDYSTYSTPCYFEIDATAPSPPVITSGAYPACATPDEPDGCVAYGGVGQAGTFTFTGDPDVTTFVYTFNGGTAQSTPATLSGPRTIGLAVWTPILRDLNVLQVQAKDAAGNASTAEYDFKVAAGTPPVGQWLFDEGSGTTLGDSTTAGTAHPATLSGVASGGPSSLTGQWQLNETTGTTATDSSGLGHPGTATGVTWSTEHSGSAVFNGASSQIATTVVPNTASSFSVAAWVKLADDTVDGAAVTGTSLQQDGFELRYQHAGNHWVFVRANADIANAPTFYQALSGAGSAPALATWTHLVGTFDASTKTMTLYVNGVAAGTVADPTPFAETGGVVIGRGEWNDTAESWFNGSISGVQLFSTALSAAEVSTVYNGGSLGGTSGGASWNTGSRAGHAVSFDGTSGYATTSGPVVHTNASFSVSAWVRTTSLAHNETFVAQAGTNTYGFALSYSTMLGWVFTRASADVAAPTLTQARSSLTPVTYVWTHLVGVSDATAHTITLYVNGIAGTPVAYSNGWDATGVLNLARAGTGDGYAVGAIDGVQVWNRVLAPQEIIANDQVIDDGTGLPTPAIQRDWALDDGSGLSAADGSLYGHPLVLTPSGAAFTVDPERGNVATLNGVSGAMSVSAEPVDAQGSFTATAWVYLDSSTLGSGARTATVFAQGGLHQDSWSLAYTQAANTPGFWVFGRTSADATSGATTTMVASEDPAQTDGWVMLSVVFDAPNSLMSLYVNGQLQGEPVPFTHAWQVVAPFTVGEGHLATGATGGFFPGSLSDVTVSTGVTGAQALFSQYLNEI